jgi:hypothetical protein
LYIGNSTIFRFSPWTALYGNNRPNNNMPAVSYDGTNNIYTSLFPASGANWSYSYSIIGNTMYVNYQYYSSDSSSAGSGIYFYTMPNSGFVIDTATLYSTAYYGLDNQDFGSQVGTCSFIHYGQANGQGPVRVSTINNITYLYLMDYQSYHNQNSGYYAYNSSDLNVSFVASFPTKLE